MVVLSDNTNILCMMITAPISIAVLIVLSQNALSHRFLIGSIFIVPVLMALAPSPLALGNTILVEAAVIAMGAKFIGVNSYRAAFASIYINGLTQPIAWQLMEALLDNNPYSYWTSFFKVETIVWLSEALIYFIVWRMPKANASVLRALLFSLGTNAASAVTGLFLPY